MKVLKLSVRESSCQYRKSVIPFVLAAVDRVINETTAYLPATKFL